MPRHTGDPERENIKEQILEALAKDIIAHDPTIMASTSEEQSGTHTAFEMVLSLES